MGGSYISISKKSGVWYGNVHKPTASGNEDIIPIFVRVEDGTWREEGKHIGARPDDALEKLFEWAASQAEKQGESQVRARWTEDGMEVFK
jgi:hypothetical protein